MHVCTRAPMRGGGMQDFYALSVYTGHLLYRKFMMHYHVHVRRCAVACAVVCVVARHALMMCRVSCVVCHASGEDLVSQARLKAGRALAYEGLSEWRSAINDYDAAMELAARAG